MTDTIKHLLLICFFLTACGPPTPLRSPIRFAEESASPPATLAQRDVRDVAKDTAKQAYWAEFAHHLSQPVEQHEFVPGFEGALQRLNKGWAPAREAYDHAYQKALEMEMRMREHEKMMGRP